ncbi:MAG: Endoglucanase [Verrucomicrobia bacterium]|nr:Endoglucanase [Verrucomicrobiota bacterium]
MKYKTLVSSVLLALSSIVGLREARADNMASIAITPATGKVALTPRWSIGGNLAGFHLMAQDLSLGGGPNQFYSIKNTAIPAGGDIAAFTRYIAASGAATNHTDIGSKLTPNSYSALTSADPDLGFGSVQLYFIHHKNDGDYFSHIVPGSGTASAVTDLKPMSQPGGPSTGGASGYFGLTFAASNLGYGANLFYYLRTDPVSGNTKFGTLIPALAGASSDQFDLGTPGYNALAFTGTDVGYGINKMYYLRLDPVTGFTIVGTLDPLAGRVSDIANLGSVYSSMTFVVGDVGFGTNQFYVTGAVNATAQTVSFAALSNRAISAGSFTVTPTASSALPVTLTVVAGSTGAASISAPVGGVFTVTPTAPGVIILQATQAGQAGTFEYNMLRQSFTATGSATLVITSQPAAQTATAGSTASFAVTASGTTTLSYQWRKAGVNIAGNGSATTATLTLANVSASDAASYDVVVTNASGSIISNAATLSIRPATPVITSPNSAPATVGAAFTYTIAASGSPTSFSATGLPAGLTFNSTTHVISGTPTTAGTSVVTITVTNASGTSTFALTITVGAANAAPVITSPTNAPGTAGTPFVPYVIAGTGLPTSFTATGLPPGLTLNTATGTISGTPTVAGTYVVTITATNSSGTSTTQLTIFIAGAGTTPSSRIVNFSARAMSGPGDKTLIMGFVVSGDGKNLLVRGIGPALTAYGIVNALADPMLTLYGSNGPSAVNDDWQTPMANQPVGAPVAASGVEIAATAARVGAFPLPAGSKDSSLLIVVNDGVHSTGLLRPNSTSGVALTEIYDTDGVTSSRLVNVSARMNVSVGEGSLIAGLVIAGNAPKTLLIRGAGPTLTAFGVSGALADPTIAVYSGASLIASNDNWEVGVSSSAQITSASVQIGAFPLQAGGKDAALLVTLQPGSYSVVVSGVGGTTGVALIEVYDTQ